MRRVLHLVLVVLTLALAAAAAAIVFSQTGWFRSWLRGYAVARAASYLDAELTIGRIEGNLFYGVVLEEVAVRLEGRSVVTIPRVEAEYDPFEIAFTRSIAVDSLRVHRPTIHLERDDSGWNLGRILRDRGQVSGRPALRIESVRVEAGEVEIAAGVPSAHLAIPGRLSRVDAEASIDIGPSGSAVSFSGLSLVSSSPAVRVEHGSGRLAFEGGGIRIDRVEIGTTDSRLTIDGRIEPHDDGFRLALSSRAAPLSLEEAGRFVTKLAGIDLEPVIDVSLDGLLPSLRVQLTADSTAGYASADFSADVEGRRAAGVIEVKRLDLRSLSGDARNESDISAKGEFDLRYQPENVLPVSGTLHVSDGRFRARGYEAAGLAGSVEISDSTLAFDGRAKAYGAVASGAGTLRFEDGNLSRAAYRFKGNIGGFDLSRLPSSFNLPPAASLLDFEYAVAGSGHSIRGDLRFRQSRFAGAEICEGTTASFESVPGRVEYASSGSLHGLNVERLARELGMEALARPRYASELNGGFELRGAGSDLDTGRLEARATFRDSDVFAASFPTLSLDLALAGGSLDGSVEGSFDALDPASITGSSEHAAWLSGSFDARVRLRDVAARPASDNVVLAGGVLLGPSSVRGLQIEGARIRGSYSDRFAGIDELSFHGPAFLVQASGPLALGAEGVTNLDYRLEARDLAAIGQAVGRSIGGSASVEGTITGNASLFVAKGSGSASDITYGENRFDTATARFEAKLPDSDLARARVEWEASAVNGITAGQRVDQVDAAGTYSSRVLAFDSTVEQEPRRAEVEGRLELDGDRRKLVIERAAVSLGGAGTGEWRLAGDAAASIEFGPRRIVFEGLRLQNGAQQVALDGVLDPAASHVRAEAIGLDLGAVDSLLPSGHGLEGRLRAVGSASGPRDRLVTAGEFLVADGRFKGVSFERAAGRLGLGHGMVSLDVRLDQPDDAWLVARGSLPASFFFGRTDEEGEPAPEAGRGLDLTIETGRMPLQVIEGFTGSLEDLAGTMRADVRLTGSTAKPTFTGFVDVEDAGFTVRPTNVRYGGVDTRLRLEGDRILVDGLRLVDPRGGEMSVEGRITLREGAVGSVALRMNSDGLTIVDNDLADIVAKGSVRVDGDVERPVVTGTLALPGGTVRADSLFDWLDTWRAPLPGAARSQPGPAGQGTRGEDDTPPFDLATVDLAIEMPDGLSVRGADIGAGRSLIGFGDVNTTWGGQVKVQKLPFEPVALLGEVRALRGTYDFQGRQFEILRGSGIRFQGLSPVDPSLDVTASRAISGVETRVHVQGTLRQPELRLSSSPALEEADILSLIVFNQPANQLGSGQQASLAERAGLVASGFVASRLAQSIGRALDLDVFEIQAHADPASGRGATIVVGERVGERLYLRLRQAIGEANVSQFILEYQLADYARVETSLTQGQTVARSLLQRLERGGLDLVFFFSY